MRIKSIMVTWYSLFNEENSQNKNGGESNVWYVRNV